MGENISFAVLHSRVTTLSRKEGGSKAISPLAETVRPKNKQAI
jgi:hypothetical protein